MLLIYGYAIRLETKNIPLSIQDWDNTPLSRTYVERLLATNQFIPVPLADSSPLSSLDLATAKVTVGISFYVSGYLSGQGKRTRYYHCIRSNLS